MQPIRVVIAEDNIRQLETLAGHLDSMPDMSVAGTARSGRDALSLVQSLHPDVLITDVALPLLDGFQLMKQISLLEESLRPCVIVLTSLVRDDFVARATELGAGDYLMKPTDPDTLARRIRELGQRRGMQSPEQPSSAPSEPLTEETVSRYISRMLIQLGISPHLNGHKYAHRAILLTVDRPEITNSMLQELYPAVAEAFGVTVSRVERSIRFAVTRSWESGGAAAFNRMLGRTVPLTTDKPSNREYIALLAERVRIRKQD